MPWQSTTSPQGSTLPAGWAFRKALLLWLALLGIQVDTVQYLAKIQGGPGPQPQLGKLWSRALLIFFINV